MTSCVTIVVDNQNLAWSRSYKRAKRANQYHDSDEYDEDKPLSPKTLILFGLGWFHRPLLHDRTIIFINNNNNDL